MQGRCKDYTFDIFCDLFIKDKHKLFDKGNLDGKHQAYLIKTKGRKNSKERGYTDVSSGKQECLD